MIESRRTIAALVRTKITPPMLRPYWVEIAPSPDSVTGTRGSEDWKIDSTEKVALYDDTGKKILQMLPDEACDVAMGILHALHVAGHLDSDTASKIESWSGSEWSGSTREGTFLASQPNSPDDSQPA